MECVEGTRFEFFETRFVQNEARVAPSPNAVAMKESVVVCARLKTNPRLDCEVAREHVRVAPLAVLRKVDHASENAILMSCKSNPTYSPYARRSLTVTEGRGACGAGTICC